MTQPAAYPEASRRAGAFALRDLVALVKPRITAMVITTTAGGLWLAPRRASLSVAALALLGTVLIVAGANTLNMYLEREVDAHMDRTGARPLPAGRMAPKVALGATNPGLLL